MRTRSASKRLTLSIVLLLYQLAAGNEGVCRTKPSHDVYVPSNDLSCQEDIPDNKSFVTRRYGPKRSCGSDFDTTGTPSLSYSRSGFHFLGEERSDPHKSFINRPTTRIALAGKVYGPLIDLDLCRYTAIFSISRNLDERHFLVRSS